MDHSSLVALFRRLVLAGPPLLLTGGCNMGFNPCTEPLPPPMTATVSLNHAGGPDGGLDALVSRCEASSGDCMPLCEKIVWMRWSTSHVTSCKLVMEDGGLAVQVAFEFVCAGGRRPEGLATAAPVGAADAFGAWLAANAHLEAASVDAFEILAAELGTHGAPAVLIEAARAATADERRHAAAVARLAARRGAVTPVAAVRRGPVRDLEAIATENAVEGCVHETHAALLACRQARAATDPEIRSTMAGIAHDETRHAALAWQVDRWSRALLTPAARRRVRDARREAIEQLVQAPSVRLPSDALAQAGLPDDEEAARLARELGAALV